MFFFPEKQILFSQKLFTFEKKFQLTNIVKLKKSFSEKVFPEKFH